MNDNNKDIQPSKRGRSAFVLATVGILLLAIWEFAFHEFASRQPFLISKGIVIITWLLAFIALEEYWRGLRLRKNYHDKLNNLASRHAELDKIEKSIEKQKKEAETLSEISSIGEKDFKYILHKIALLLDVFTKKEQNLSTLIRFIAPLDKNTLEEAEKLADIASQYELKFEWNITEKTNKNNRFALRDKLIGFISSRGNTYLTGELPIFDKLLVIPGVTIIGFIEKIWFSWNLTGVNYNGPRKSDSMLSYS